MPDSWLEDLVERIEVAADYLGPMIVTRDLEALADAARVLRHWIALGSERDDEVCDLASTP